MIVTSRLRVGDVPSAELSAQMKENMGFPVVPDEECPELTDEFLKGKVMVSRLSDGSVQKTFF